MKSAFVPRPPVTPLVRGILLCSLLQTACADTIPLSPALSALEPVAACTPLFRSIAAQRALQLARTQVNAQGMRLQLLACPTVQMRERRNVQVLHVRVVVLDAEVASRHVRGPLVEGYPVDMGERIEREPDTAQKAAWAAHHAWVQEVDTGALAVQDIPPQPPDDEVLLPRASTQISVSPAIQAVPSTAHADEVSPDVVSNRQWLVQLMQSHGFVQVPGMWWAFVPPQETSTGRRR